MLSYMTIREIASLLSVPVWRVDWLVRTRKIPSMRIAHYRVFGPEALEKIRQELATKHKLPEGPPPPDPSVTEPPSTVGPSYPALVSSF